MKLKILLGILIFPFIGFGQGQTSTLQALEQEVDSLIKISNALTDQKAFEQAMAHTAIAEKRVKENKGEHSAMYAKVCSNYGRIFYSRGGAENFLESEKWSLMAKVIREKDPGKEHPDYARSLYSLALISKAKGEYKKALELLLEAISIREKALGKEHVEYIESLIGLGNLYYEMGELDKAIPLALEVLEIQKKTSGIESPEYAESLNSLALLYARKSEYNKALALHQEALGIRERVVGKDKPQYAWSLNNLAMVYTQKGQYEKALAMQLEAQAIMVGTDGKDNQNYALMLRASGNTYFSLGRYDEAQAAHRESADIIKKLFGAEHPNYALALTYLGRLYKTNGDYEKAIQCYNKAKAIQEKMFGTENSQYANSLFQLARLHVIAGEYEQALVTGLKVRDIWEKSYGKESTSYGMALHLLAEVYVKTGDYDQALPLFLETLSIREKKQGKRHREYANCLNSLAHWYHDQGAFEQALSLFQEAKTILESLLGNEHYDCASTLYNIAMVLNDQRDHAQAATYFQAYNEMAIVLLEKAAAYSSEKEMLQMQAKFIPRLGAVCHFAQNYPNDSLLGSIYNTALYLNQGLLFSAISREKSLEQADTDTRMVYDEWKSCNFQLAKLYASPIAERDLELIGRLETQANDFEKELARRSESFVSTQKNVQWHEVQDKLRPGEAAIEFVHFPYTVPKFKDSTLYGALILLPGNRLPQFIPLFEKNELLPFLRGATGGNNFIKINAVYTSKPFSAGQKSPYELIWKPLEQSLKNISTVFCAPSGLLHYLNLAAIPGPGGKPFGEHRQLILLGSTRSLAVDSKANSRTHLNAASSTASADAYLAGGIRYESNQNIPALANQNFALRSSQRSGAPEFQADSSVTRAGDLNYLSATATEVREIGQMLRAANFNVQVDTGFFASEEAFRSLGINQPSPRVLHLATHGYFFPDPKGKKTKVDLNEEPVFKISEHPMIRSGLIMAGAKQAWLTGKNVEGQEDGILTAYEISQMNLSNTELVVLSACETGLGQVSGTEGVYGLQRAFKIAGAKYLIMSLWKVDDQSTKDFMTEFYRQWLGQELSIPAAFLAAQQKIRAKYPSPYDWAGFVLIE
jgi:CHAT domain-containing protein/tetratricopeptide (TPR) repeat protein